LISDRITTRTSQMKSSHIRSIWTFNIFSLSKKFRINFKEEEFLRKMKFIIVSLVALVCLTIAYGNPAPRQYVVVDEEVEFQTQPQVQIQRQPLPKLKHTCVDSQTSPQSDGGGNLIYLDRQNVECPDGTYMRRFHLTRPSGDTVAYQIRCCTLTVE